MVCLGVSKAFQRFSRVPGFNSVLGVSRGFQMRFIEFHVSARGFQGVSKGFSDISGGFDGFRKSFGY